MYSPKHYLEDRDELIYQLIEKYSFATLISNSMNGLEISHLPFLLEFRGEKKPVLLGHMAKANPHWKSFQSEKESIIIFQGPHSYISPAWYQPNPANVPTWNYVAIHLEGKPVVIENQDSAYAILQKTVRHFETEYQTNWSLPLERNSKLDHLLSNIVAFEIPISSTQAKFKLSQNQASENRDNVISELSKRDQGCQDLANLMKLFSKV